MKRFAVAVFGAALLLAGCGDKEQLTSWCQKRMQEKGSDASVNCECFAKTVIGAPEQSQDRKDAYKALMSVVPLYAAGKDEEADGKLAEKGIGTRISVAAMMTGAALRCAVVK